MIVVSEPVGKFEFYRETKFKDTEIGRIPEEWGVVRLGGVAKIRGNKTINNTDRVAVIPMELVPDNGIFTSYKILPKNEVKSSTYCEAGDVLLAKITPSLENGKQGIVPLDIPNGFAMATTEVFPIVPEKDKLDRLFLFYILKANKFRQKIIASMTGTTGRQRASKKAVINLQIPCPPLPEQRAIARVLADMDEAIEAVGASIESLERIKHGLMQRLLTRGLGHERFKDTEIGRIPVEWEVVRLGDIVEKTEKMDPTKMPAKKFRYLDISNIDNKGFTVIGWNEITGKTAPSRARKLIKAGDVVFATTRPYLKNIAIIPPELDDQICSTGFCVLRAKPDKTDPQWIFYNLLTDRFISRISARMVGATYPSVSDMDVFNMKIPRPPLPEQKKIAEILSTVDEALELKRKKREKLERMKKKMMELMLTGRVRVRAKGRR